MAINSLISETNLGISLASVNFLDLFLWTFRKNEKDVVNLYTSLSPLMQLATGGSMLNFGLWSKDYTDPIAAQNNLCAVFADMAELSSATHIVDVGSGLSAPSRLWQDAYPDIRLYDVNIVFEQLAFSGRQKNIEFLNSTSTKLPFADSSVDRVLALESAQHFKPLADFVSESKRVLKKHGLLVIAIPVTTGTSSFRRLGLLKFTWSSEHYTVDYLKNLLLSFGFTISEEELIGSSVYEPLADYYLEHRPHLRELILKNYAPYVEGILFKSLQKMKKASEEKIIDYVLLKCHL